MKLTKPVIPAKAGIQHMDPRLKRSGMTLLSGILVIFSVLAGCVSSPPTALLTGQTLEGAPICLDSRNDIPAIVRKFFNSRDLTTEEGKVDYLIERVRDSGLTFVRNRVEYDSASAAEFLRWKLNRWKKKGTKVGTAQEFISIISSGSSMSGQPYSIILKDGSKHNLQSVLQNELDALTFCLKQYTAEAEGISKPQSDSAVPTTAAAN